MPSSLHQGVYQTNKQTNKQDEGYYTIITVSSWSVLGIVLQNIKLLKQSSGHFGFSLYPLTILLTI